MGLVQPFPQLFRLVRREPAGFDRFLGRELYRDDLAELARLRGYRGLPLRGDGPWEVARDFPGRATILALTVDPVAAPAPPPKPRRDAVRVLDDPDARKPRAPREAAPRVRVSKVELVGAPDPVARAEACADLHALTDALVCGTEAFFLEWQKKKFKDPAASWQEAQQKLAHGSEAAAFVRAALVAALGLGVKTQGRWAWLPGDCYLELGSRHAFEGPLRDWVPPWTLDARKKAANVALELPFERETDEDTADVVETIAALAKGSGPVKC
jgi:hypothetical protein